MEVFRLSKKRFAKDLIGKGAELAGGRWNSKGTAVLYTAQSRALCTAELAVHLPLQIVPKDYQLITIEIPNDIAYFEPKRLPKDWNSLPHSDSTQKIGDQFVVKNEFLMMKVPSVVVQGDFNYVLNPLHPLFSKITIKKIESYRFDKRFFIKK
ncbi:MAG: RES family NAD+ phosphorylase [Flavobacteriales bacterium]